MSTRIVMALYKPHPGKREEFKSQIDIHVPTLREYELVTDRQTLLVESEDGTFIEIFEWVSEDAHNQVHQVPAISKIWETMGLLGDFVCLKDLAEANQDFPHFKPIDD